MFNWLVQWISRPGMGCWQNSSLDACQQSLRMPSNGLDMRAIRQFPAIFVSSSTEYWSHVFHSATSPVYIWCFEIILWFASMIMIHLPWKIWIRVIAHSLSTHPLSLSKHIMVFVNASYDVAPCILNLWKYMTSSPNLNAFRWIDKIT